ncbi:MAG: CheR family methyltransferase [Desulfohalobiaceae bacterium]
MEKRAWTARDTRLPARLFREFSRIISRECGIKLPENKKIMLESRMRKRLRELSLGSFEEYRNFFHGPKRDQELTHLIDVVTTNTTEFFRETSHFEVLSQRILPEWASRHPRQAYRAWSAGCSSGEEPYTLAMVLHEYEAADPGFDFTILATDISTRILQRAVKGIYPGERAGKIPRNLQHKYLLRSRDKAVGLVRMAPEVRARVEFARLNLMEEFDLAKRMDGVFCRNVLIYFDRPTQDLVLRRICRHLAPGGHLFIGHSESLSGMGLPLRPVAPTVYRKDP